MADVQYTNFTLNSANNAFSAIWKLSRALKKAGYTYLSSSDGSAKDTTGVATSDKWGGSADPSSDTYSSSLDSVAAWWNASGPVTVKIPFIAASSGTFLRGEKITQATSLAEGELVGYDFDGVSVGHLVVLTRSGTFNNSNVITGYSSSATLTPSGTIETYVHEIVLFKNSANTTSGSIYLQRVCNETENSSRFSVLAGAVGCTVSVAPGAGGTGNAFPTLGSYVMCGSQNAGTPTHSNWFQVTANLGKAQIVVANNTPSTGVSPDGSWWILMGDTATSTSGQFLGYFRVDNSEDGDLDPYVSFKTSSIAYNSANVRTDSTGSATLSLTLFFTDGTPSSLGWKGWRRRGFSTNDSFIPMTTCQLKYGGTGGSAVLLDNTSNPETVACSYSSKRIREPIYIASADNTKKMRKGTVRWLYTLQGGTTYDTWDSKTRVCVIPSGSAGGSVVAGSYDGSTVPLQS